MASLPLYQLSSRPILAGKPPRIPTQSTASHRFTVSCNAENGKKTSQASKVDRRNLLLGMGGLYGATSLISVEAPPSQAEYAGAYSQLPHKHSMRVKSKIRLGLTELLEDLDVEDDEKILVTLVPRAGGDDITIGGVKIIYA